MSEEWITFTLRLPPKEYELVKSLARLRGISIAAFARESIMGEMTKAIDADEIVKQIEIEKQRLLEAADAIRKRKEQGES